LIDNAGYLSTKVSELKEGIYLFQLMATDNEGATGVDTVSVIVFKPVVTLTLQPWPLGGRLLVHQRCNLVL